MREMRVKTLQNYRQKYFLRKASFLQISEVILLKRNHLHC